MRGIRSEVAAERGRFVRGRSGGERRGAAFRDAPLSIEARMVGLAETSAVDALFGESGGTGDGLAGIGISSLLCSLIGHHAEGTGDWRGGPTRIGERGPEIIDLPAQASLVPNAAALAIAGSGKASAPAP